MSENINTIYITNSPTFTSYSKGNNSANYDANGTPELLVLYNVGTTGGPSAYGTYDQSGNGAEWSSPNVAEGTTIVRRGGSWAVGYAGVSQIHRQDQAPDFVVEIVGFRLASSQASSSFLRVGDFPNYNDDRVSQDDAYYGSVDHLYYIGKYEITIAEYCAFLTAVGNLTTIGNLTFNGSCLDDVFSLYNAFDTSGTVANNGITRSGSCGNYSYEPTANYSNRPVTFVSWLNCARYANWMHNGKGSGDTEDGAYTLGGNPSPTIVPSQNAGAIFWIPTENEWYKAAYYKSGSTNAGYWRYSTQSDRIPTEVVAMLENGNGVEPEDIVGTHYPNDPTPNYSPFDTTPKHNNRPFGIKIPGVLQNAANYPALTRSIHYTQTSTSGTNTQGFRTYKLATAIKANYYHRLIDRFTTPVAISTDTIGPDQAAIPTRGVPGRLTYMPFFEGIPKTSDYGAET